MKKKYLIVSLLIFISVLSCNFLEDAANNAGLNGNTTLDLPISYNLSSVSRTLATDYGITVSSVTVTVENGLFTYGPDVLTFDADTDIASGTIQDIVEGTYTVTLCAYMLDNDSNQVLVAEGIQEDVSIISDQTTNVDISMSIVVGLGDLVINGTISENSVSLIEISDLVFYDYPAVWFSPSTGEIVGIIDETPPEEKYRYWIEPNDPEFTRMSSIDYGILLLGNGDSFFENATYSSTGTFSNGLSTDLFVINNVFYIHDEVGDCVIQILGWNQENNYLQLRWKRINE